jgi:chemotaxis protein MotB
MQENGLQKNQVSQVRGFADQEPRNPQDPLDPSNRRITVIIHNLKNMHPEKEPAESAAPQEQEIPQGKNEHAE